MRTWNTVAIIGVGLIGGSIGLAIAERKLARRVIGIGRQMTSLRRALDFGCITDIAVDIAEGVREAELVVVCTPVDCIGRLVAEVAKHCSETTLITDAGSTKVKLVQEAEAALADRFVKNLPFVGSHPIAGSERNGPEAANAKLFEGRVVVVTPTARTDPAALPTIEEFWRSLGGRVMRMSPDEHDAIIARTSHLPHLVASALAATTPNNGHTLPLTGSGWADTTRIASGDPELWKQIFLANRAATLNALTDFETVLKTWRHALENAEGTLLTALLQEGKRCRDALGS